MGLMMRQLHALATCITIVFVTLIGVASGFAGTDPGEPTRQRTEDGVVIVTNSAEPRDGTQTVHLEELWRVGGENEELFFGMVPRVLSDESGNIYVLDTQLCHVHVFSPEGTLMRTLFREGEGPGEVRGPRDMFLMNDGTVAMVLETGGVVVFVTADGKPAGRFSLSGIDGGIYALVSAAGANGFIVLAGTDVRRGERTEIRLRHSFLGSFTVEGEPMATFAESDATRNLMAFHIDEREDMPPFLWCFDVTDDGVVYAVTDRDRYTISVFRFDGTRKMIIEREYEQFVRSDEEYRAFYGMIETANESLPIETTITIEQNHASIAYLHRGLHVLDDGSLWVLTERGIRPDSPGVMAVFDIFDDDGVYLRRIALRAPHDGFRVGIVPVSLDRIVVIKGYLESLAFQFGAGATFDQEDGDWEHPEVICYRMIVE